MEVPQFLNPDEIERFGFAMICAVDNNNINKVKNLLADGVDPNSRGFGGRWPCLYRAVDNKCTSMVKLLLIHGVSSRRSDEHYTALDYAAGRDNVDVIRIL